MYSQLRSRSWMKIAVVAGLFVSCAFPVHAQTLLTEGFEDASTLTDWFIANNSENADSTYGGWFLSDATTAADVFPAQAGTPGSYAFSNFQAILDGESGTISTWLITPSLTYRNGDVFSFFTRTTVNPADFPDRMELRFSASGTSTNVGTSPTDVGDFTRLLLTVNPSLNTTAYPANWTQFSVTLSGLSGPTAGRFAFHYFVTDGGPFGNNSDFIGVDTVSAIRPAVVTAPEPGTVALFGMASLPLCAAVIRRRKRA